MNTLEAQAKRASLCRIMEQYKTISRSQPEPGTADWRIMLHLEQRYCERVTGATPGRIVKFRLAVDPSRSYVGIVQHFRFSSGGDIIFMTAELIRQHNRSRSHKLKEFQISIEPQHLPVIVDDDWPEFKPFRRSHDG